MLLDVLVEDDGGEALAQRSVGLVDGVVADNVVAQGRREVVPPVEHQVDDRFVAPLLKLKRQLTLARFESSPASGQLF